MTISNIFLPIPFPEEQEDKAGGTTALFDIPRPQIVGPEWLRWSAHAVRRDAWVHMGMQRDFVHVLA